MVSYLEKSFKWTDCHVLKSAENHKRTKSVFGNWFPCGYIYIIGAEALRIEFDRRCSTERRHDPLTIMDSAGRNLTVRSGKFVN